MIGQLIRKSLLPLVLLIFALPAMADIDFIGIGQYRFCVHSDSFADRELAEAETKQLLGRTFDVTSVVIEEADVARQQVYTGGRLAEYYASYSYDETAADRTVLVKRVSFTGPSAAVVKEHESLAFDIIGCYGGYLTFYNVPTQPNESRFSGPIKIEPSGFSICEGDCDAKPLTGQQQRRITHLTAVSSSQP